MEIQIQNFRDTKERTISFKNGVNLLKGDSGAGKSTIFESVRWCLYGGMKDIISLDATEKDEMKIMVRVKTSQFEIVRTNRPSKVIFSASGKKYTGDEATSKIKDFFGTKGLWETCSYLVQDEKNFLLQSSQREKTEIMKEILFEMGREDTDWYKEKFEKYREKMKERVYVLRGEVDLLTSQNSISEPEKKEIKEASKLEDEIVNLSVFEKRREKIERKIEEYEKFKNIEREMKEAEKILNETTFPFEFTPASLEGWRECKELISEKNFLETKE